MKTITPHLWFDTQVKEAVDFYVSLFPNSRITHEVTLHDVPSPTGDSAMISFELGGQPFMAINGGPYFTPNPSISFFVNFDPSRDTDARAHLDTTWEKLSEGGKVLMDINEYSFSKRYGWVQDRFGISWQLMLSNPEGEERPFIITSLLYTGAALGRAEEAANFYCSVFKDGKLGTIVKYPAGMEPNEEGSLMYGDFNIMKTWIAAMDGAGPHDFTFNEGISLLIPCDSQEDIDYYWEKLSADPAAEQCGWLKDKFGMSWQVWPTAMGNMMSKGTPEQIARVTKAFLPMKKFDLAALQKAFDGN